MPISTPAHLVERYHQDEDHFQHVLKHLFVPAVQKAELEPIEPMAEGGEVIQARIIEQLEKADLVLCDVSSLNPNVFFELGIRTALDRPVCLVKDQETHDVPFDIGVINHHEYSSEIVPWKLDDEIEALAAHLKKSVKDEKPHNSLWKHFGISTRAPSLTDLQGGSDTAQFGELLLSNIEALRKEVRSGRSRSLHDLHFDLGGRLRRARIQKGLSTSELAERANVAPRLIHMAEKGTLLGSDKLSRIAEQLGVELTSENY